MSSEQLCQRCAAPLEPEDLRCPVCALGTPGDQPVPERAHASILRCEGCGSAMQYDAARQQPRCAFCGASCHLEEPEDPIEQAEAYLPFALEPEQAQQRLRRWLGRQGFFRPSDLASAATVQELQPLWWAGWQIAAQAAVSWTADSDAGAKKSKWAPHAGLEQLRLEGLVVSASHGLSYAETRQLGPHYRLDAAVPEPQGPAGAQVERFEFQRSAARQHVVDELERRAVEHLEAGVIPGSRSRRLHLAILLEGLRSTRLGFPAFVLAYRYRKRLYRAVVHGQDGDTIIGEVPTSWLKVAAVIGGGTLALLGLLVLLARLL